jgi:hypothetical protein
MQYCDVLFVANRRAIITLLTIIRYVTRLNACYAIIFVGGIILYNERIFYR